MQAKLLKWTSRPRKTFPQSQINNNETENILINLENHREINANAAIPSKIPLPLRRVNATYNLIENIKVNFSNFFNVF